ncbi:MAG: tetratricopeptide repeat protein [Bacteroidota bacterium]
MKPSNQALILDYLAGRLSGERRREFEAALAEDAALAEEVNVQRRVLEVIDQAGDLALKERLGELLPKYQPTPVARPRQRRRIGWWAAAAAAILLLLLLGPGRSLFRSSQADDIFAQHYQAYELPFGVRGNAETRSADLQQAASYYQSGDFYEALGYFEAIVAQNPDSKYRLALAICQMEIQQYHTALQTLYTLIEPADLIYAEQARWYAALAHLALDQSFAARPLLQSLADAEDAYQGAAARQLLREEIFFEKNSLQ